MALAAARAAARLGALRGPRGLARLRARCDTAGHLAAPEVPLRRHLLPLACLVLVGACRPSSQPAAPEGDDERAAVEVEGDEPAVLPPATALGEVVSPSLGAVLRVPWVSLLVRLPAGYEDARVEVRIDDVDRTDPLGRLRTRWSQEGGGLDYIASLEPLELGTGQHALVVKVMAAAKTRLPPLFIRSSFTVDRPACPVDVELVDGAGQRVPGRVLVRTPDGPWSLAGPDAAAADPAGRDTRLDAVILDRGMDRLWLDPGTWTLVGVRGPRYDLGVAEVTLPPGCTAPTPLRLLVPLVVDTPGRLAVDLHVHTARSGDAFVPDAARYKSLVAADLDAFVITDHQRITQPGRVLGTILDGRPGPLAMAGVEARIGPSDGSIGHVNFFPLMGGDDDAALPPSKSGNVARIIDLWRARQAVIPHPSTGTRVLAQLNHPRGLQTTPEQKPGWSGHAYFSWRTFDRSKPVGAAPNVWMSAAEPTTGTTALDIDVLEVLNRFSWVQYQQVRFDWFVFLNLGRRITGSANSDSHALAVELAGMPCNLVQVPPVDRERDPVEAIRLLSEAIRGGRSTATNGPVVDLEVVGVDGTAGPGSTVAGATVRVRVRVRAAAWVPVPEVRVVVDGKVVETVSLDPWAVGEDGVTRHESELELVLTRDSWVVAEAGWPLGAAYPEGGVGLGSYAWVAPGYLPVGFTNPVWIDWDHDGQWTPRSLVEVALDAEPVPPSVLVPKVIGEHRAKQQAKAAAKRAEAAGGAAKKTEAGAAAPPTPEKK